MKFLFKYINIICFSLFYKDSDYHRILYAKNDPYVLLKFYLKAGLRDRATKVALKCDLTLVDQVKLLLQYGKKDEAVELIRNFVSYENHENVELLKYKKLAILIAPFDFNLGLVLALKAKTYGVNYVATLSLALKNHDLFNSTINKQWSNLSFDKWLLLANKNKRNSGEINYFFNRYLKEYGLSGFDLFSEEKYFNILNIKPRIEPALPLCEKPLVSIILTTYNASKYIEKSIYSLLVQSYRNIELIIIDDGSNDDTLDKIKLIDFLDLKVKVISLSKNVGTYKAKNIGLMYSKGEYIAFQDADDFSHPDRIRICLKCLLENKRLIAVSSNYIRLTGDGSFLSTKVYPFTRWTPNSVFFKKNVVLKSIGGFDSNRFGADSEFVTRLKVSFGESRHRKIYLPLIYAAARSDSLMLSKETGVNEYGYSEKRMIYQERWAEQILSNLHLKKELYKEYKSDISKIVSSVF